MIQRRLLLLLLLLLIGSISSAWAQTGIIQGTVSDVDGHVISGAKVELDPTQLAAVTDPAGKYRIKNIPAGNYLLRTTAQSYVSQTAQISLVAGQTMTQNIVLEIDLLTAEQIVVTGTATPEKKIESTTSISSVNTDEIREAAPRSTTEFLRRVPGFTRVESSGGEVNQNLNVRGFLIVSSISIEEDGVPVYPTMDIAFMNADNLIRLDENIERVEILRSGSSPIFASSSAGAIINFINKTGGDKLHGAFMGAAGTAGLGRVDFDLNGPLSPDWRFNAGGYYRYDHGVRDPGYTGTQGGQIKANVTRLLSNGFFRISYKGIDDSNLFITPLPFQNRTNPDYAPGFSDTGSFYTKEAVDKEIPLPPGNGKVRLPLDDGINTRGNWVTGQIDFNFAGDWQFENTAQYMSVDQNWNAIVSSDLLSATEFAQSTLNDYIHQKLVPPGTSYEFLFTNHSDSFGNQLPFDTPNGLVRPGGLWNVQRPFSDFSNILTIKKLLGRHNFSFGSYFAYYKQSITWYSADILTDVRDNPRFLDLVLIQPDGTTLDVTKNGFLKFLSSSYQYLNGNGNSTLGALFSSDEFKLSERLRIDLGIRYELEHYSSSTENTATIDLDGDKRTQYDIESFGNQTFYQVHSNIDDLAFSTGINYQVSRKQLALYGSFTRGFQLPGLDAFFGVPSQEFAKLLEPFHTDMYEAGVKYSGPLAAFSGAFFYGQLYDFITITPQQGGFQPILYPASHVWGFEFEVLARPTKHLELHSTATYVDNQVLDVNLTGLFYKGFTPAVIDFDATYSIFRNIRLMFDCHHVAQRFSNSALTDRLADYTYFNLAASYRFPGRGYSIEGRVLNLTQSKGLEESNPLYDPVTGSPRKLFLARPLLPRRITAEMRYEF